MDAGGNKIEAGMPPKLDKDAATERVQIVAPTSWLRRIEEWRRAQPRIPTVSGAIRELVEIGLAASAKKRGPP